MTIQDLILGQQVIATEAQRRKILLGGYLIIFYIGIGLFFFVVNLFNPDGDPTSIFIGFFVSIVCLVLLRKGYTNTALVIHFTRANYIAFYFSMIDESTLATGTYVYFVPASLGALAVYGYTERWKAIGFVALSFTLFLIALLRPEEFKPDQAHFYFIMNFLVIFVIGVLIILFFDQMVVTAERKLIDKNDELVKINRELDQFTYSASHDLRAPLSSILGLITISRATDKPEEFRRYLDMMEGRVRHLDGFIQEIIDHSRNARLDVERSMVNVHQLVSEIIDDLKFSEQASRVQIINSVPIQQIVNTDIRRLRVILTNLLSNAIRYSDPTKDLPFVKIDFTVSQKETALVVEDNGQGIQPEYQARIFDMFFRAAENSKGSGLGLYIARETVQRLGGNIEVKSKPGSGSTFKVTLPS
jgi:signal transduction histidine kinase